MLGDWTTQANWGAPNSSYVERDRDIRLKGFDDRPRVVDVVNPRTGVRTRTTLRDYAEVLPLARDRFRRNPRGGAGAARARPRCAPVARRAAAGRARPRRCDGAWTQAGHARGAAVVLDVASGGVLASVSYPQPAVGGVGSTGPTSRASG